MGYGNIALVLNAHLPFVRHPDFPCFLEERWLFESMSETYLPLLRTFAKLDADSIPWKLSLALSPTLTSMMGDKLLCSRYTEWLKSQIELAEKECIRNSDDPVFGPLSEMYRDLYCQDYDDFNVLYGGNILSAFGSYMQKGRVDILTSAATGAFLPIYRNHKEAISSQIETAIVSYRDAFGCSPSGFWLPQLGWYPGLESILASYGLKYTVVSTRSAMLGTPTPLFGSYAPVACNNGFSAFIRDVDATNDVWSATEGYPSDPVYREFYRDIGYDLPLDYIGSYIEQNKIRTFTGFKYWSITGKTDQKVPYNRALALKKVEQHAEKFILDRKAQAEKASEYMKNEPLMVAPYDAELFGHWWFEGPDWIESVFRKASEMDSPRFITMPDYLLQSPNNFHSVPEFSSWGAGGYGSVWVEKSNDWVYRHTFKLIDRMVELAERFPNERGLRERILNQAAREVLLSQASDWPFLMRAGKSGYFARQQVEDCVINFTRIYEMLCSNNIGTEWVTGLEKRNNLFPNLNYRIFRPKH